MAAKLTEPAVLAAAKDTFYPDLDIDTGTYAVTETQFTTSIWDGWGIPVEVRRRLAPVNIIRLTDGEPDLVGVGLSALDVLDGTAATTPLYPTER
jgi:hypothetical protein